MHINWYVLAAMFSLFGLGFCLTAMATDDTEPWKSLHFVWYFMLMMVVILEMGAIVYLA